MKKGKLIRDWRYWIPVDVALPTEYGFYNVTLKSIVRPDYRGVVEEVNYRSSVAHYNPHEGLWRLVDHSLIYFSVYQDPKVVAWTDLPKAYIPEHNEGGNDYE